MKTFLHDVAPETLDVLADMKGEVFQSLRITFGLILHECHIEEVRNVLCLS